MLHRDGGSWEGLYLDGEDSWQVAHNWGPGIAGVGGNVDLAAAGAEVDAAGIEGVYRHGVAEDVDVAIALREAFGERFPLVAAGLAAVDAEFAVGNEVFAVAFDGRDVDCFGLMGVDVDYEAEISGEVAADFVPEVAGVVAAHDVPVLLHEEGVGFPRMHGDVVNAVANLGVGIGNVLRDEALVDRLPGFTRVIRAESTGPAAEIAM